MAAKWCKTREKMNSSSKEKNKSDIKNDIDLDQAGDKYLLQL